MYLLDPIHFLKTGFDSQTDCVDEAHFNVLFLFLTKLKWIKFYIAFCLPKP